MLTKAGLVLSLLAVAPSLFVSPTIDKANGEVGIGVSSYGERCMFEGLTDSDYLGDSETFQYYKEDQEANVNTQTWSPKSFRLPLSYNSKFYLGIKSGDDYNVLFFQFSIRYAGEIPQEVGAEKVYRFVPMFKLVYADDGHLKNTYLSIPAFVTSGASDRGPNYWSVLWLLKYPSTSTSSTDYYYNSTGPHIDLKESELSTKYQKANFIEFYGAFIFGLESAEENYSNGYHNGYSSGYVQGQDNPTVLSFLQYALNVLNNFLSIPVLGSALTIGGVLSAMVFMVFLRWLLGWFR